MLTTRYVRGVASNLALVVFVGLIAGCATPTGPTYPNEAARRAALGLPDEPVPEPLPTTAPQPAGTTPPAPASAVAQTVAPPPAPHVEVKRDDFSKSTTFVGPAACESQKMVELLATALDGNEKPVYSLVITHTYGGSWRFYDMAYDERGQKLSVRPVDRSVLGCSGYDGCTYFEGVSIRLDRSYLEAATHHGIRLKLYGRGDNEIFSYPGSHIEALLEAADRQTPRTAPAKAPARRGRRP